MQNTLAQLNSNNLSDTLIKKLLDYIEAKTGMIFAARLKTWVLKQVETIAIASKATDITFFVEELIQDKKPIASSALFESLTVHETMFFRDKTYFNFMKQTMFPQLIEQNSNLKSLKIWVAAGSSGQEAYSILFMLHKEFPQLKNWNLQITSTDLSQQIINKGKEGIYEKHEVKRGLSKEEIEEYFQAINESQWQVKEDLRTKINFKQSNLVEDFKYEIPKADFISCRNVLIYFNDETKYDIIKRLAEKTEKGAYLLLGQVDYINAGPMPKDIEQKTESGFPFYRNISE